MDGQYKDIQKVKLEEIHQEDEQSYKLQCPSCETVVPAKNINIVDKIAKCDSCDSVFPFDVSKNEKSKSTEQNIIQRPSNVTSEYIGQTKEIVIRDKKNIKPFMTILYLFSFMTLAFLFIVGVNKFIVGMNVISWAFTLWYTYIYRDLTQKVYLDIDDHIMSMEYAPWFFTRKREVDISIIQEVIIQNLVAPNTAANPYFQVSLRIDKGDGIEYYKIMPWTYHTKEEAEYIKQELDNHLQVGTE